MSMFAYLISKLSKQSHDKVQGDADWALVDASWDPLEVWLIIQKCHQILTMSKLAPVIKKTVREEYLLCKQGQCKHIVDYKKKFDVRLDALIAGGNTAPPPEDVAMDFMYGLDNTQQAEFKGEIINDLQKGTLTAITNLNKMYVLAIRNNSADM